MRNGLGFALFWAVATLATAGWASAQTAAVRVVVHDSAAVNDSTLAEALEFSASVFRYAGVDAHIARSSEVCPATATSFCVMALLRPKQPRFQPGKARTMGVALEADPNRAVVSLYIDAILDVARRYGQPVGRVLGIALAHEMGHVLLPPPSHSASGIMQPSWEGDDIRHAIDGDTHFTEQQALLMRDRLKRAP